MKNITCKDCKYFVLAVEGLGLCHAAPPVVRLMTTTVAPYQMAVEAKSYRPKVRATDRCCKEQAWDPDREQQ
jgi:hypothetical protein